MAEVLYARFENMEAFNVWHARICRQKGIPSGKTLRYSLPIACEGKDYVLSLIDMIDQKEHDMFMKPRDAHDADFIKLRLSR